MVEDRFSKVKEFETADSVSASLGWALRVCLPDKLLGRPELPTCGPHAERQGSFCIQPCVTTSPKF